MCKFFDILKSGGFQGTFYKGCLLKVRPVEPLGATSENARVSKGRVFGIALTVRPPRPPTHSLNRQATQAWVGGLKASEVARFRRWAFGQSIDGCMIMACPVPLSVVGNIVSGIRGEKIKI